MWTIFRRLFKPEKKETLDEEDSKDEIGEEETDTSPVEEEIVMCTCATDVNSTSKIYAENNSEITNGKNVLNNTNIDFVPPFKNCSITNGVCSKGGVVYITEDGQKIKDIEEFFGGGILTLESLDEFGFYMGKNQIERTRNLFMLNETLIKYEISSDVAVAYFLDQAAKENRFGARTLEGYNGNNPEEYLNKKYDLAHAERVKSGNLGGNDGELFRGAGYIQLTGRANYENFASYVGDDRIVTDGYKIVGGTYIQMKLSPVMLG